MVGKITDDLRVRVYPDFLISSVETIPDNLLERIVTIRQPVLYGDKSSKLLGKIYPISRIVRADVCFSKFNDATLCPCKKGSQEIYSDDSLLVEESRVPGSRRILERLQAWDEANLERDKERRLVVS